MSDAVNYCFIMAMWYLLAGQNRDADAMRDYRSCFGDNTRSLRDIVYDLLPDGPANKAKRKLYSEDPHAIICNME